MSTRRSSSQVNVPTTETPKRGRGRPPKAATPASVKPQSDDTTSARRKGRSNESTAIPKTPQNDDVSVTSLSIRRSGRSRIVKSARELLGMIPADEIKKEAEESHPQTSATRAKPGRPPLVKGTVGLTTPKNTKGKTMLIRQTKEKKGPEVSGSEIVVLSSTPAETKTFTVRKKMLLSELVENRNAQQVETVSARNLASDEEKASEISKAKKLAVEVKSETVSEQAVKRLLDNMSTSNVVEECSETDISQETIDGCELSSDKAIGSTDDAKNDDVECTDSLVLPPHIETVSLEDAAAHIGIVADDPTEEDVRSRFSRYTIRTDDATGSAKIVTSCDEVHVVDQVVEGDEEEETFEGLVDPETGLIIADSADDTITLHQECADGQTVEISSSNAQPFMVQQLTDSHGDQPQYILVTNDSASTPIVFRSEEEDAAEPSAKRQKLDDSHAAKVLQSLQRNEASLIHTEHHGDVDSGAQDVTTVKEAADHEDVIDTLCKIQSAENSAEEKQAQEAQVITSEEVYMEATPEISSAYAVPEQSQPMRTVKGTDRRMTKRTVFSSQPMTSEELASVPLSRTGRCVPQKHVVVAPELQDLIDHLKQNDVMENHIVPVGVEDGLQNKCACRYCGMDIPNRHFFRRHINIMHKEIDFKPWKCPLCDYKAIIKAAIARHINVHSDMKPYTCLECGKGFTFRQKLQIHMKYHKDQRDHKCALCEMAFHELKTLKTHLQKIHGIDKPKQFIDKYRNQPLTSVLVQLEEGGAPTQGYILPKDSKKEAKPVAILRKKTARRHPGIAKKYEEQQQQLQQQQQQQLLQQQQEQQQQQQEEGNVVTVISGSADGMGHVIFSTSHDAAAGGGEVVRHAGTSALLDQGWQVREEVQPQQVQVQVQGEGEEPQQVQLEGEELQQVHVQVEGTELQQVQVQVEGEEPQQVQMHVEGEEPQQVQMHVEGEEPQQVQVQVQEEEEQVYRETEGDIMQPEDGEIGPEILIKPEPGNAMHGDGASGDIIEDEHKHKYGIVMDDAEEDGGGSGKKEDAAEDELETDAGNDDDDIEDSEDEEEVMGPEMQPELGAEVAEVEEGVDTQIVVLNEDDGHGMVQQVIESSDPVEDAAIAAAAEESDSECDEVNVLLPRQKKSSIYGTRKTLLRTSRYKLGLENITPMSRTEDHDESDDTILAPAQITLETATFDVDTSPQHNIKEEGEVETVAKKPVKAVKVINNQKIVSEHHLEDELKKYCKIDTTSAVSRIIFTCTLCPSEIDSKYSTNKFYSKTQFCAHLESKHTDVKPWLCVTCGFKCRLRTSLLAHYKTHELVKKHECSICERRFLFKQKLNVHMRSHANLRVHACEICDKRFNETTDVTRHMKRVHADRRYNHECNQCDRSFRDEDSLIRHMEQHDPDRRYLCPYCKQFYRSKGSLAQHMKSHTCMFHCEICSKNFGSYSGFMAHKVMHDQSFEGFECDICKKRLHTKGSFVRHKTVAHSDVRPFSCSQCNKSFKTKKDLKNHGTVHTTVRAYACSECQFTCKRLESLKIHMRRHSEIKPYQCGLCGKEYTQRSSLEAHLRHHTGQAEGKCNICEREFSSRYMLRKHLETVHGENTTATAEVSMTTSTPVAETPTSQLAPSSSSSEQQGLTVYMCEECNAVFLSQDDLAVHILAEHMRQGFSNSAALMPPSSQVPIEGFSEGLSRAGLDAHTSFSVHHLDEEDNDGLPGIPVSTSTIGPSGEQVHYVSVNDPSTGEATKVVSLVHPPAESTPPEQRPHIVVGEDGQLSVRMKQEDDEQDPANVATMVTITDPTTNEEVMLPMVSSALDALLAASGMDQQGGGGDGEDGGVETVVEELTGYEQVAETVEVQE